MPLPSNPHNHDISKTLINCLLDLGLPKTIGHVLLKLNSFETTGHSIDMKFKKKMT